LALQQKPYLTCVVDEAAQARYVAQQILKAREAGVPLKQQVVLFRSSYQTANFALFIDRPISL
jgi:DNA helicase-2/ATP-dependent DNA helicase PcrA